MLAGVEDQQHALVAQMREHRVELRAAGLLGQAELLGDGVRQQLRIAQPGQRDQADAVRVSGRGRVGGARATRVLPTPPGPTSVTSRLPRSSASTRHSSAARPMKSLVSAGS